MNVHSLKGSHRENWSFANVLITVSLTELNPWSIMKERVWVWREEAGKGNWQEISAWPLQEPAACCSKQ